MAFTFEKTKLPGVMIIQPKVFGDSRGYFMETYKKDEFVKAGIDREFLQDNESSSTKGVLRGLHFQKEHTQGKLVSVTAGRVYDVAVDVRPGSETFGKYVGVTLDSEKYGFDHHKIADLIWIIRGILQQRNKNDLFLRGGN